MLTLKSLHHVAIICSDYERSKYREERNSYKLDLAFGDHYQIELFSFPNPPERPSFPEAIGLRHLAFEVQDLNESVKFLLSKGIKVKPIRVDEFTGKEFTFFQDPNGLPLELYEGW